MYGRHLIAIVVAAAQAAFAPGEMIVLSPASDNTLYSEDSSLSNGAGQHFFCGRAGTGGLRRALLRFYLPPDIPPTATIYQVWLTLNLSQTSSGPSDVSLHRVLQAWGEGLSDAPGGEGGGAAAMSGDATWEHRFFDQEFWTTAGGEFDPSPVATQSVAGFAAYTWSSAEMIEDAREWLITPESNHGWILLGDERGGATAKRFDSRQNPNVSVRPQLIVGFALGCPGDVDGDHHVDLQDLTRVLSQFGIGTDQCRIRCPEDFDGDGDVDLADLAFVLSFFGSTC